MRTRTARLVLAGTLIATLLLLNGCSTTSTEVFRSQALNGHPDVDECRLMMRHVIQIAPNGGYHVLNSDKSYSVSDSQCEISPPHDELAHVFLIRQAIEGYRCGRPTEGIERCDEPTHDVRLLFVFHGGLVDYGTGMKETMDAARTMLAGNYAADGSFGHVTQDLRREVVYPIFMNWDSSAGGAYWDALTNLRRGEHSPKLAKATAPFKLLSDFGTGLSQILNFSALEAHRLWETHLDPGKCIVNACGLSRIEKTNPGFVVCPADFSLYDDQACLHGGDIRAEASSHEQLQNFNYVTLSPLRMVTGPVVVGSGDSAWEVMKRRTMNAFEREPLRYQEVVENLHDGSDSTAEFDGCGELIPLDHSVPGDPAIAFEARRGIIRYVFDQLFYNDESTTACFPFSHHDRTPNTTPAPTSDLATLPISLIGHSMGTMLVSEIVATYKDLPYRDIVFLGAASEVHDFQTHVLPLLSRSSPRSNENTAAGHQTDDGPRFFNVMLLPTAEASEQNWFGAVPSGSLLDWIDDAYQDPPTKFHRTMGKWANVRDVLTLFPADARERMTLRVLGRGAGQPVSHGALNDVGICFWLESYWTQRWPEHCRQCAAALNKANLGDSLRGRLTAQSDGVASCLAADY